MRRTVRSGGGRGCGAVAWGRIVALVVACSSGAVAGPALTLQEAVRIALERSPEARAAAAQTGAAAARAAEARLWENPEIEFSGDEVPLDGGGFARGILQGGIAQAFPFPGKKRWDVRVGQQGLAVGRAEEGRRRLELVREVKATYFRALTAGRVLEMGGRLVEVADSSGKVARRRVELGKAALQEQLRAEILVEEARAQLSDYRREREDAHAALMTLLGRSDSGDVALVDEPLPDPAGAGQLSDGGQWMVTHPEYVRAFAAREMAEATLRRVRLDAYPDPRIGLAGGRDGGSGGSGSSIISVRVSVPLPLVSRSRAREAEARAGVEAAQAEMEVVSNRLRLARREAENRVRAASEQVVAYRDRVLPRSEEALRLVRVGFEDGKFEMIDLLDTQRTAAEARVAYERKVLELRLARLDLENLAGGRMGE